MKHKSDKIQEEKSFCSFPGIAKIHPVAVRQKKTPPPPPSEETVLRLNAIVKQIPFCFHYRENENDLL
jgi:hypothetical protein